MISRLRGLRWLLIVGLTAAAVAACDGYSDEVTAPIGGVGAPVLLDFPYSRYTWVLEGFDDGEAVGHQAVELFWEPSVDWSGEPFRVYGKSAAGGSYLLVATVTSCLDSALCRYTDLDVSPGTSYDYFVVAVDERTGREFAESDPVRISVPALRAVEVPEAPRAVGLDGAVYLAWSSTGAQRYQVYLDDDEGPFIIGETDGTGFLDERAENGVASRYRIAAISDTTEQVSDLSVAATGIPRPDFHAEVVYAFGDSTALSGFRFVESESEDPIVAGDAAAAQWRLESIGGVPSLRPLGDTQVTSGEFTTALSCGPASDSEAAGGCLSIESAPSAAAFQSAPVRIDPGYTYVFRVTGDDGRIHYGKVRILGSATDRQGELAAVFDWAYQLRPDEPSLNRG